MQHVASERITWKKVLKKESPLLLPVAHDALAARLIEQAGFAAVQIGGFAVEEARNDRSAKSEWLRMDSWGFSLTRLSLTDTVSIMARSRTLFSLLLALLITTGGFPASFRCISSVSRGDSCCHSIRCVGSAPIQHAPPCCQRCHLLGTDNILGGPDSSQLAIYLCGYPSQLSLVSIHHSPIYAAFEPCSIPPHPTLLSLGCALIS